VACEVAVGQFKQFAQRAEIRAPRFSEDREDPQPRALMDDVVDLV
jgi:hypothetical protein